MAIDEKAMFVAAAALPDARQREAYLQEACAGAPDLLSRLKELLSAHEESQGPLDRRPAALGVAVDAPLSGGAGLEKWWECDQRDGGPHAEPATNSDTTSGVSPLFGRPAWGTEEFLGRCCPSLS